MSERTNHLLLSASDLYGADIVEQVSNDYSETVGRYATIATFNRLILEMSGIYSMQEKLNGRYPPGNYDMAKTILEDVAMGEGAGLVMHYETDFSTLSERLTQSIAEPTLNISAVICPDWGWHMEGDTLVYDMDTLNDGVSKTAERTFGYVSKLAKRANYLHRPISFNGVFSGWEFTRKDDFPNINGGINTQQGLDMLESTRQKTEMLFSQLNSEQVETRIISSAPKDYHQLAQIRATEIVSDIMHRRSLEAVLSGRRDFYKGDLSRESAALELAEAQLGFQLASANHQDILVVPTSPTIARACMSGQDMPFIQLKHGYRG